jgi:MarR family 2-MHQ and catechol resistance regulon transcriptional repressor
MKKAEIASPKETLARREAFYADMRKEHAKRLKDLDLLAAETCFNLVQTYNLGEDLMAGRVKKTGLTLSGINVLIILYHHKEAGYALNALSDLLLVTRANITGLIDSLSRKGLVTREEHPKDRRVVLARITPKGEALLVGYMPAHFGTMREMTAALEKVEKETLIRILTKMRHSLLTLKKQ